jgi:ribosomal protein L39E
LKIKAKLKSKEELKKEAKPNQTIPAWMEECQ